MYLIHIYVVLGIQKKVHSLKNMFINILLPYCSEGGGEIERPGNSQTINLQPTQADKPDKKPCCN